MKRLLLTFALIFAFVCAQAADITSISNAFKAGNASSLSGAMDKVVDVALPGSSKKCNGSEAVYKAASEKISLSKMTFSHQMIRLIFIEQIYRAMTILNNEPYHHE